jgi:lipid-A-disaccharide synthase
MARIAVVAGETSGDIHAGNLVSRLLKMRPDLEILAIGGERLEGAGARLLSHYSEISAMGLFEVAEKLPALRRAKKKMLALFRDDPPDLFIPVDFGGFNLVLAREAKKAGVPVIYFIPPKAWAWGSSRVEKIRKYCDHLLAILPFEEDFWRGHGVSCDYVGSPVLDHLADRTFAPEPDLIGLLPGSRKSEVTRIWPHLLEAARLISRVKKVRFAVPLAEGLDQNLLADGNSEGLELEICEGRSQEVMERSRVCLVASGTATLECALVGTPMVTVYRANPLSLFIARRLIAVPLISLPNLIAGREIVPELVQKPVEETARAALRIFDEGSPREEMLTGLSLVREKIGKPGASEKAAGIILHRMGLAPVGG